ncbi:hypothetical protein DFQ28_005276 [Apophysomyces sp. BC1034]|nr:hypothetical protein DFQ30_003441 [Apophysomyces sp. BC1015]KAG0182798.1 hypothetical protein DFQ29_001963 [Apophysomyces sp. BC1021]KAG0193458.1 hypothetical protein DFQ28_005276 [Apophysomyces sp. BC1034]
MTLTFGYEMEEAPGHVVVPPLLSNKITLTSAGNTSRWIFYGTRGEIIDWIRRHSDLVLENAIFFGGKPTSFYTQTELVIDLQYIPDEEQSYYNYLRSFFVNDYSTERVKVEIRPRVDSKDHLIMTLCRVIVASGISLGDVVDDLDKEWHKPTPSYYQQTIDMFNDSPGPVHIVSADAPASIHVGDQQLDIIPTPSQPK